MTSRSTASRATRSWRSSLTSTAMGIVHMRDDGVALPGAMLAQAFVGPLHHIELAAYRADWEKAIRLAAQEIDPPLEHRLLRDAGVQLGRGEQRLSLITVATAVEIAVGAHLRSHGVNVGANPTLGQVLGIARDQRRLDRLGLDYNRDVHPALVSPRNAAVHNAYTPSTAETIAALDLATTLVRHFAPLDSDCARPVT